MLLENPITLREKAACTKARVYFSEKALWVLHADHGFETHSPTWFLLVESRSSCMEVLPDDSWNFPSDSVSTR